VAFLTESEIRQKFNIEQNRFSQQITSAIDSARRKIGRWVTADVLAEAVGDTAPTDADALVRYESVLDAHAFLTMYYLAVSVGTKFSADGAVKSQQDAGSPGLNSKMVTNSYLTPAEMAAKKQEYYDEARDIVEPYFTSTATDLESMPRFPSSVSVPVVSDW
jgi:hypothetical protein